MTTALVQERAPGLRRRARLLVWLTIAWNVVEAVVALTAGSRAGSGALVSFGLDSTVEVSAALVALWYLGGADGERERAASRLIAVSFWALAAWVGVDAVLDLLSGTRPDRSGVGIALTALSALVMPGLAIVKRRTGQALGSKALVSESSQTAVCAYLSVAVLLGLVLSGFGWHQADPIAALVVAAIAVREGVGIWRERLDEDGCC